MRMSQISRNWYCAALGVLPTRRRKRNAVRKLVGNSAAAEHGFSCRMRLCSAVRGHASDVHCCDDRNVLVYTARMHKNECFRVIAVYYVYVLVIYISVDNRGPRRR